MYCETPLYFILLAASVTVFAILNSINYVDCDLPTSIIAFTYVQIIIFFIMFINSCLFVVNAIFRCIRIAFIIPLTGLVVTLILDYYLYHNQDYSCEGAIDYHSLIHSVYYTQGVIFVLLLILFIQEIRCFGGDESRRRSSYENLEA